MGGGVYLCCWEGGAKTCGSAKFLKCFWPMGWWEGRGGLAVGFRVGFVGSSNVVLVLRWVNEEMGGLG